MKIWRTIAAAAAAVTISSASAHAQAIGIQGAWGDDTDLGLGARLEWGLNNVFTNQGPFSRTFLITEFNYFFPDCDECSFFELNANVAVPITANTVDPYAGLGLNIGRVSVDIGDDDVSETEAGLNLFGGLRFRMGSLGAYAEGRAVLTGYEQFVLTLGVLVGGGR